MNWTARCTVGLIALSCMSATWPEKSHSISIAPAFFAALEASALVDVGSVRGTKWLDSNGDGARDSSEPGLSGVTIYLDLNDNGQLDAAEPATVTDEAGQYWFDNLAPGVVVVREVVPDGFVQTFPANGGEHLVELASGQIVADLDFGNQETEPGSVRGTKWLDSNGDGARDPGEPGLPGVTIYLDLNDNGRLDMDEPLTITMVDDSATATDDAGQFWFIDLQPGRYVIREVVPDGFVQTFPANGGEHLVELESGTVVESVDFGNALRGHRLSLCHKGRVIHVDRRSVPAHLRHRDRLVSTGANACGSNSD